MTTKSAGAPTGWAFLVAVFMVAIALVAGRAVDTNSRTTSASPPTTVGAPRTGRREQDLIRPGPDAPIPGESGAPDPSQFELTSGKVVRWNACGPIDWRLHRGPGPANARTLAATALQHLSNATGLTFRYAGTFDRPLTFQDYADHAAARTIFVEWATPNEVPLLKGNIVGEGGFATRQMDINSGLVAVDTTQNLSADFNTDVSQGGVLLHELGHVMGLAHSLDRHRIMYPSTQWDLPAAYQPGDLAVLATAVAPGPCNERSATGRSADRRSSRTDRRSGDPRPAHAAAPPQDAQSDPAATRGARTRPSNS